MRKVVVLVVLVLLVLAGGWLVLGGGAPQSVDDARAGSRAEVVAVEREPLARRAEASGAAEAVAAKPKRASGTKEEREVMRQRILEAMHARERTAAEREGGTTGADEGPSAPPRQAARPAVPDDGAPTPGNLIDRTGNHGHMVKVMNEDLIPLTDECYALARETQPELEGLLVLDVEMIGDEDIGGVIETVAIGQGNELTDPGLIECVQESLLSVTLPPPPEGGRDAISLSLRLEPEEG